MNQARRGLADTALGIGVDISSRISILYAPPAAWSHGYLWGADVVTIPRDAAFSPQTNAVTKPSHLGGGGVDPGTADRYALKIDSPTAVRTLNGLLADGVAAQLALASFTTPDGETLPAGSAIFAADPATKATLAATGAGRGAAVPARPDGVRCRRSSRSTRVPRIAVLVGARQPERLVAAEPRLHRRPGLDRRRSTRQRDDPLLELRRRLQHRRLARRRPTRSRGRG